MNKQQAAWAAQHDWFLGVRRNSAGSLTVVVRDWDGTAQFYDFQELRAWAGY